MKRLYLMLSVFVAAMLACESAPASRPNEAATGSEATRVLNVITTSNIVGDWVANVGGDRIEVFSLLPVNADPHTFQPGARDTARVAEADLVFTVGLTLEAAWFQKLVENASADSSKVATLGEFVNPIPFVVSQGHEEDEHEEDEHDEDEHGEDEHDEGDHDEDEHDEDEHDENEHDEDEHEHGELDPHFWFDPLRVKQAVTEIASRLSASDPEGAELYQNNAQAYNAELDALHEQISSRVSEIPQGRRLLVTSHESLGYFAERYGFEIVGAVVPGVVNEREPSAQELAELVDDIQLQKVPAIFTETTISGRLVERISEEAGVRVVTGLKTGSLGNKDSATATYLGLMRSNVDIIVGALK